ncbi:MAG: hypothetical protein PHR43_00425 [Dehalococcoidales bacterium]|nr:hypothetical protein [Dehalococcoidales bacterium]
MTEFDAMKHYLEMDAEVNKIRTKLNFQRAVQNSFKFLVDKYGFHCLGANLLLVKYESKDIFVKIYHDRLSYEIELYIGLKAKNPDKEIGYTLVEIMNMAGDETFIDFKARTCTEMADNIKKVSDLIMKYGTKALEGDADFFSQLDAIRKKNSCKTMIEEKEKYITPDVERAWKKRDYKQVAKLYGAYENYLTQGEKLKLEYARKQLNLMK